jgi:hypothetical protein
LQQCCKSLRKSFYFESTSHLKDEFVAMQIVKNIKLVSNFLEGLLLRKFFLN